MNQIMFKATCGKGTEMLYDKPIIFFFYPEHISVRCNFAYSAKQEDEMMPDKHFSVDEQSYYFKKNISSVEWAYNSQAEVYLFSITCDGQTFHWNVESKQQAMDCVNSILQWLLSKN